MTPNRREFLGHAAAGAALAAMWPLSVKVVDAAGRKPVNDASGKKPLNVIFLMSDQHRAMSMGAYGPTQVQTPHLDKFAAQSVLFERAYCPFPQCVASRQSLLTGQYPSTHGAHNVNMKSIDPDQWTVAHAFAAAGYETAYIGKDHSNISGFTINKTYRKYYGALPDEHKEIIKGEFFGFDYMKNAQTANPCAIPAPYCDELLEPYTVREAIAYLKQKHDKPFYVYISLTKPHPPFNPPQEFWDMYPHDQLELPPVDPRMEISKFWSDKIVTEFDRRNYLRGYYACVSYIDWCVGQVLKVIEEEGYFNNSIVSYTSDHGESGGWHGVFEKHCFFEPAERVPLVIRTPWTKPLRVKELVDLTDVPVTQTDLCDIPIGDHKYEGQSLRGLLNGDAAGWKNFAMSEYYQKVKNADGSENADLSYGRMLVQGDWKCCINGNMIGKNSLYNLKDDPQEFTNLWDSSEHRAVRDEMVALLTKHWRKEWFPYGK